MGPEGPLQMAWSSAASESLHTPQRALTARASKDHWHWSASLLNTRPRCSSSLNRWHPFICLLAITVHLPKWLSIELKKTELLKDQPVQRPRSSSLQSAPLTHQLSLCTGGLAAKQAQATPEYGAPCQPSCCCFRWGAGPRNCVVCRRASRTPVLWSRRVGFYVKYQHRLFYIKH